MQLDSDGQVNLPILILILSKVKCHIDADSFSRMPFDINKYMPQCTESISEETVKTMYQSAQAISVGKVHGSQLLSTQPVY